MSDIFLSYASTDRPRVRPLVQALERCGWSVWWDPALPLGRPFDRSIQEALDAASCVVVVWSRASVDSDWVRVEAGEGKKRDILIPVLIDDVRLPLEFRLLQAVRLLDWQDGVPHQEFDKLVRSLEAHLGPMRAQLAPIEQKAQRRLFLWATLLVLAMLGVLVPVGYWILTTPAREPPALLPITSRLYDTPYYHRSYALVIGIDLPYAGHNLPSAVEDAKAVVTLLERQQFNVIPLYNQEATKEKILQQLRSLAWWPTAEDRVLVFFAGNGATEVRRGKDIGYLVPAEATSKSDSYVSMDALQTLAKQGKARHQLFLMETRFGGLPGVRWEGEALQRLDNLIDGFARHILLAGERPPRETTTAPPGRGWFTAKLLEALQDGNADVNGDCYVALQELVDYIRPGAAQTLQVHNLLPGHDHGEFVFRVQKPLGSDTLDGLLSKKAKNLCGHDLRNVNLRQADLRGVDLREADLRGVDLHAHDLRNAGLQGAKLSQAILDTANLSQANLSRANMEQAQLQKAQLPKAILRQADLLEADLSEANLDLADLREAKLFKANLRQAQLGGANLRGARLRGAILSDADLRRADVAMTQFEPQKGALPTIEYMKLAKNLAQLTYDASADRLKDLRQAFESQSMDKEARQITYAIKRTERRKDWEEGEGVSVKARSLFQLLLFELPCQYGMSPARPLLILACSVPFFAGFYVVALKKAASKQRRRAVIWVTFVAQQTQKSPGKARRFCVQPRPPQRKVEQLLSLLRRLHLGRFVGQKSALHLTSWLRILRISLYFSLLSTPIGWRDVHIGKWLPCRQARHYTLSATGWVRSVSGLQSLIDFYLLALWGLTYFTRPFG